MKKKNYLTLDDEFLQYCKLNNIEDIEKTAKDVFSRGFTILKYGEIPIGNKTKEKIVEKEVIKEIIVEKEVPVERIVEKEIKPKTPKDHNKNRNSCSICRDGGDLILCDGCPKSFHLSCLKLKESDLGDENWYCANCVPKIERRKKRERIFSIIY